MKIDLNQILSHYKLDRNDVADLLFPNNAHKLLALGRAIKGLTEINSSQLSRLAEFIGVSVDELYSPWKQEIQGHTHKFICGEYVALLDTNTWVTRIFHNDSLKHASVLHSGALTLDEYFDKLNLIIKSFQHELSQI